MNSTWQRVLNYPERSIFENCWERGKDGKREREKDKERGGRGIKNTFFKFGLET